eukprot:gb/GEZN01025874.1/.p1 GENE.gb/GEZN01025874.1/~~gb/GEZN01025874.1/.p1  ORF type:complete len:134 (-),score=4.05 gb/GEZN01025874.1/:106-507(-)
MAERSLKEWLVVAFFVAYGLGFAAYLGMTLSAYPMFPFQPHDAKWSFAWLMTTVGDYYGVSFALSAIILSTEPLVTGVIWVLIINLLGCPFACVYVAYRIYTQSFAGLAMGEGKLKVNGGYHTGRDDVDEDDF